ncbi:hypothetical protein NHX12_003568 [Muraenolepis orangiensis]|uniref:Uncharacterized protein n=1 Tax=Muraenolepis orangiensis TaxID=630683 RepID=A0A9Q0E112_9TELE|nr:hypothetical protein NHX12_003568 [Muraenolepis orangiensis]
MSAPPSPGGLEVMTSLGPAHGEVMSSLGPAHTEVMTSLGPAHTEVMTSLGPAHTEVMTSLGPAHTEVMTSLGPTHTEVMTSLGPTHGGVMTSLGPALSQVTMTTGSEPALSHAPRGPWLYLEQLADTLLSNAQQLKALIGQAKQETCQSETGTLGHLTRKEVSQDWKEHQHSCQPGAPLPLEEDPLTTMDITKVMV